MDILSFLLIGLAAGWIAGQIMKTGSSGIKGDLIVGILGALLGGLLFKTLGLHSSGMIGSLITATLGAVAVLALLRYVKR